MILRLLGIITLFIALSSSIVLGATIIAGFQPELYASGYTEPKISVDSDGNIVVLYSYNVFSWRTPFTRSSAYDYNILFEAPLSPPPSYPTIKYKVKECRIYAVSDPQVASNLLRTVPNLAPYTGGYINPTEYNVAVSILESVADYKDTEAPVEGPFMSYCSINAKIAKIGSMPQLVLAEVVLDTSSVEVRASDDMYINGSMMAKVIENITTNPNYANVATVTYATAVPSGPQPPTPIVSTVVVAPREPELEYLMREFIMAFERSNMQVSAIVTLDVIDMWRIASIMLAGFMIIVIDASRNPRQYTSGPWRVFRRIAELLGIAKR